jgi:hypothetical protein
METIDITPPAIAEQNPNRDQNIKQFDEAAAAMECAVSRKARFLDELVEEEFGGIENVMAGLHAISQAAPQDLAEMRDRYVKLQAEHDAASRGLIEAIRGQ